MTMTSKTASPLGDSRGFTLVEVLVASMILVIALLSLASMFPVGYRQIADAGRMTMAVTGARHILEDVGDLPFGVAADCTTPAGSLDCFNPAAANGGQVFDTSILASLPASNPAQALARRWRYMLAGSGDGFSFTSAETTAWGTANPFGGRATVRVDPGPTARTRVVTVTVTVPGLPPSVTVNTVAVSMF